MSTKNKALARVESAAAVAELRAWSVRNDPEWPGDEGYIIDDREADFADQAEREWLAARLEAFARYLREEWARSDAAVLREQAEFLADGMVLEIDHSWWDPKAEAAEDEEHRGHGCSRDPDASGYVSPLAG